MKRQTKQQAFDTNVVRGTEDVCWPAVVGGYNKKGWHVTWKCSGARVLAHRVAWELFIGGIPDNMFVLHRCDNPKCCNPKHLFLGTQSDNAKDMHSKGRGRPGSPLGLKLGPSPFRKLPPQDVGIVKTLFSEGKTKRALGEQFGVTDVTVGNIIHGKTYKD